MDHAERQNPILPPTEAVALLVSADEPLVQRVRSMVAPDRGITLHVSGTVGDAEIEALEVHPTVVLLDLELPGRTPALELLRRLRKRPETSALPVIVLGGPEEAQLRAAVFDAGAADFVEKLPDPIPDVSFEGPEQDGEIYRVIQSTTDGRRARMMWEKGTPGRTETLELYHGPACRGRKTGPA